MDGWLEGTLHRHRPVCLAFGQPWVVWLSPNVRIANALPVWPLSIFKVEITELDVHSNNVAREVLHIVDDIPHLFLDEVKVLSLAVYYTIM